MTGLVAVDLDGTLAHYTEWVSETHVGPPIPRMVARVKRWRKMGIDVRIFTARVGGDDEEEIRVATRAINSWCLQHLGERLPVTNKKDYHMLEQWDDRAVQVEQNSGRILGRRTRKI